MGRALSEYLDLSRWVAALVVVFGHAAALLASPDTHGGVVSGFFLHLIRSAGHEAVMVFFVISGFLVGGRTLEKWLGDTGSSTDYVVSRFSRIYVVLVPALVVGYLLDTIGIAYFNDNGLYAGAMEQKLGTLVNADERMSFSVFMGNLFMLEGVSVTSLGSNVPLWSLAYEWWYYTLFFVALAGSIHHGWKRVALWSVLPILLYKLPGEITLWMFVWLLGAWAYFACDARRGNPRIYRFLSVSTLAVLVIGGIRCLQGEAADLKELTLAFRHDDFVAIAYACSLYMVARAKFRLPAAAFSKWAANFSYSTYLFHFPVLLFLVAVANSLVDLPLLKPLSGATFVYMALLMLAVYACTYGLSQLTERHTDTFKRWLSRSIRSLGLEKSFS